MAILFDPKEISQAIQDDIRAVREIIGIAFIRDVVPRTPVLTGHARRNWQVSWGVPTGNELPGVDKSGGATIANGVSRMKTGRSRNPFLPVIIENNVPYIGKLNAGSSRQAPSNFVELSINKAINSLNQSKQI